MLTSGWDLWFPDSDWESEGSEAGAAARGLHSDGGKKLAEQSQPHLQCWWEADMPQCRGAVGAWGQGTLCSKNEGSGKVSWRRG